MNMALQTRWSNILRVFRRSCFNLESVHHTRGAFVETVRPRQRSADPDASSSVVQTVNSLGAFRPHLRETSAKREQLRDVGVQYVVATEEQNFVDEVLKITNGREQMSPSRLQRASHRGQAKRWRRGGYAIFVWGGERRPSEPPLVRTAQPRSEKPVGGPNFAKLMGAIVVLAEKQVIHDLRIMLTHGFRAQKNMQGQPAVEVLFRPRQPHHRGARLHAPVASIPSGNCSASNARYLLHANNSFHVIIHDDHR
jgi:hypothetical protein